MINMKRKSKIDGPLVIRNLHRFSKIKANAGGLILLIGISFFATGLFVNAWIQGEIDNGMAQQIIVPDPEDNNFEEWRSNKYEGAIPFYTNFYMWNLTNPSEYYAGGKPKFEEVGPYSFRQYSTKYNVTYNSDKTMVSYNEYSTYEFDAGRSGLRNLNDKITNINPGYLGVLNNVGAERNLIGKVGSVIFNIVKEQFEAEYNYYITSEETWAAVWNQLNYEINKAINDAVDPIADIFIQIPNGEREKLVNEVYTRLRNNVPSAEEVFLEEWAFGRFPEIDDMIFAGITIQIEVEDWVEVIYYVAKIICWLFGSWLSWVLTIVWELLRFFMEVDTHMETYGIGDRFAAQAHELIVQNLDFDRMFFEGLDNYSIEIGSLSFIPDYGRSNDLYSNVTFQTLDPSWWEQCVGEPYTAREKVKKIWDPLGYNSLISDNALIWFDAAQGDLASQEIIQNEFGLMYSYDEYEYSPIFDRMMWGYFNWYKIPDNYISNPHHIYRDGLFNSELEGIYAWIRNSTDTWLKNIVGFQMQNMSGGLVTTRTVEEWLFTARDPLISAVDPEQAAVNIFSNCSNETEAEEENVDRFTIYTGQDDISKAKQIIEFNGEDEISTWATPMDVGGSDGTQFAPGLSLEDDTLEVFQPDLLRKVEFKLSETVQMHGIDMFRYKLSEDTFKPSPEFYMDTEGLANLSLEYGIPAYLSKPHFLDADSSVRNAIIGMNPDPDKHETYIDVEPITGITMNVRGRLQINFKVAPTDLWYTNIQEIYAPILWVEKEAEIPENDANQFTGDLYGALALKPIVFFIFLGIGSVMILSGAILAYIQTKRRALARTSSVSRPGVPAGVS